VALDVNFLAAEIMEEQIDTEMKKMDELDDDDIEKIRQRRLKAMQKAHQAKQVCSRSQKADIFDSKICQIERPQNIAM